jgi:hypothetical protein
MGENIKLGMLKKHSAFYLCTTPSQDEIRAKVEEHIN